jgi:predicted exporter/1-acyl-sn-glycerol-3-phosphate acyltransferase/2-polyprenyl-3-methyl-5-hydroxy-6-metoxy-1,4-benzoquinol methylase
MELFFLSLYRLFSKRTGLFVIATAVFFAAAAYFAFRLTFEENISSSIPEESEQIARIVNESRLTNKIIIHIQAADTTEVPETGLLTGYAAELSDSLKNMSFDMYLDKHTLGISDSLVDEMMALLYAHTPVFLTDADYLRIDSLILPAHIDRAMEKSFNTLVSPAGFAMKQYIVQDPLGISALALAKLRHFQVGEGYEIVDGFIFANHRRDLLFFVDPLNPPNETGKNALFFKQLDDLLEKLNTSSEHAVTASYFGAAAVAVGNAEQIKKDISYTVTVAMVIILLFVGWFFRRTDIPFISFLPAVFGGVMALALIFLARGSMSIIALGIGSVLLGIIVDYALYFYSILRNKGDIEKVMKDLTLSILMCSATSAAAFFSLLFVKSQVLRDLGMFAGFSILGAAFFSLVILPQIARRQGTLFSGERRNLVIQIARYPFESNRWLILAIAVLTVLFVWFSRRADFDTDMYSINYMSDRLQKAEQQLNRINGAALKSVYLVSTGASANEALEVNEKVMVRVDSLLEEGVVSQCTNPGMLLASDSVQQDRIRRWNAYWTPAKRKNVRDAMVHSGTRFGFTPDAFGSFLSSLDSIRVTPDPVEFKPLKALILNDMITVNDDLAMVVSLVKVSPENRHKVYTQLSKMPGCTVIDRLEITKNLVGNIRYDFELLVSLSMVFVTLLLVFFFGRIETGLITAIPMFLSWMWTLGFMGITGIRFNIINIIVTTFVFGLGVDYSILMIRGHLLGYRYGHSENESFKTSVFLSGFTTLVGVGALLFAKHPSLHSIAMISVVGVFSVVLISYTVVPLLFGWLIRKKGKPRVLPVIFSDILTTILVFGIFVGGSLVLNLMLGLVMLLPVNKLRKKTIMHKAMAFCCKLPVYSMFHIKKRIVNLQGEDFSKPAMIISNHQSHIDLLLLLMLHPKIIVLTNRWVWNNPIYALVIRYLEFYPVMEGYGDLPGKLRASVQAGYSILVFPEGSRSADARIRRFHKGSFLMAEQLGLDLLPVFIHGASDCMTKGENHLRGGSITVKIYPRVRPDDPAYGADYHERTRNMLLFYRSEWVKIREELETPDYFRLKLVRNYIYKGPVLEWYTRIKLRLEDNYALFDRYVPRKAIVTDIGCGYGYLSLMLGFVSGERQILGIDYDEEKINLARNCISRGDHIRFEAGDANDFHFEPADVFIFGDMLHYLDPEHQEGLLDRCISLLHPGGRIIIRDADRDLNQRHRGTRYTEFFSTRSGFNKSDRHRLYFFSGSKVRELADRNGLKLEVIDNTHLTSNVMYVLQKPAAC